MSSVTNAVDEHAMTDTDDLVARLERLSGPDREVDATIALAVGWRRRQTNLGEDWISPEERCVGLPYFTASIDAAMTLVPKGHCWQIKQGIGCQAIVWSLMGDYDDEGAPCGESTTFPAIALCIASLRARSRTTEEK